jgi:hypothetical protein
LIHQKGTEKGIIAFNVPGNSGYLLSLSGRTFGTLHLGKNASTQNKSYSGSGINNLVITGDLIIDENINFKLSLTGDVQVKGNITNLGSFTIAPSTSDTSKRKLLIDGDSMIFINNGVFEQNINFNGITVSSGTTLKLRSPLTLTHPTAILLISKNAFFEPGDYYFQGGKFYSDSMSTILVSSTDGISSQPNKGNIRSNQISINLKSSVIFCGVGNQQRRAAILADAFRDFSTSSITRLSPNPKREAARATKPARLTALSTMLKSFATASTTLLLPAGVAPSCWLCQPT